MNKKSIKILITAPLIIELNIWICMIILKIRSRIYPDKRKEFDQAIEYLLKLKDERKGKFYRTFYEELDEPNMFCYVEEWESMEALKKHLEDNFRFLYMVQEYVTKL